MYKLPDTVSDDQQISLIVDTGETSVLDAYYESGSPLTLEEYTSTAEARSIASRAGVAGARLKAKLSGAGIKFESANRTTPFSAALK